MRIKETVEESMKKRRMWGGAVGKRKKQKTDNRKESNECQRERERGAVCSCWYI